MPEPALARRAFLARIGLVGIAGSGILGGLAAATPAAAAIDLGVARRLLRLLAADTFKGLGAFVVPADDPYSTAQGTPSDTGGALAAEAPRFVMESLDNFVPFPDAAARTLTTALSSGLAGTGVDLRRCRSSPDRSSPSTRRWGSCSPATRPSRSRCPSPASSTWWRPGSIPPASTQSSMRMGASESDSVLDPTGEARWVKRLFVADHSALPNALGGPNPTLSSQALATRTAAQVFVRYFGGDPYVASEAPVVSTDERISTRLQQLGL